MSRRLTGHEVLEVITIKIYLPGVNDKRPFLCIAVTAGGLNLQTTGRLCIFIMPVYRFNLNCYESSDIFFSRDCLIMFLPA